MPAVSGKTRAARSDLRVGARFRAPTGRVVIFCGERAKSGRRIAQHYQFAYEDAEARGDALLLTPLNLCILEPLDRGAIP
ncbi:hypothetical protein HDG34_005846 [Paraburkholderia sp. HC6.4b]|uniref:hypothetical protein n=1 Tax=unclassified Paraburkholderia TaxID=2615204 RepID=UPI001612C94A|nr:MULTISPECIES: hypothetical protein [unclassified Paraburkholderia]MBB5411880.1 hypothetical protein [Paraburkholderia sp. HC6.4b]MBB5450192.1 hypothetical protein [Paraburkholderia sp. Kb1A]